MRDGARLKADVFRPYDDGKYPAILNLGPYQKDKLWIVPETLGEARQRMDELGNRQSEMVGAARLRRGARRRPRHRQVARPMRAVVVRRGGRFLRRHRMGGGAAVVQRQCRAARHFLFRDQSMVRRQSAPPSLKAIIPWEGFADLYRDALLPRRHPEPVHDQLVHGASACITCSGARRNISPTAGRSTRCISGCATISTAARFAARRRSGTRSMCRCSPSAIGRAWRLHLRGNTEAFMRAATPHKKLRIHLGSHVHPFYTEDGRRRSDPLLRLLAQGHRQRRDGRAAGQARRSARAPIRSNGGTSTNGRSSARAGPSSISICRSRRRRRRRCRRSPARWR